MRIRYTFVVSLVFLLAMLMIGGIRTFATTGSSLPRDNSTPQHNKSLPSRGASAITPTRHGTPAFTAGDVRQYYLNHSFSAGPTISGTPPTIVSIRFITTKDAQAQMGGEPIGLPNNAMVCYVELRGPFYPKYVSVPPGQTLPATFDSGVEVFDAQTGNLLLWGVS